MHRISENRSAVDEKRPQSPLCLPPACHKSRKSEREQQRMHLNRCKLEYPSRQENLLARFLVRSVLSLFSRFANTRSISYVGIYNKRTKTAIVRPAPLHVLIRQLKAFKNLKPVEVSAAVKVYPQKVRTLFNHYILTSSLTL